MTKRFTMGKKNSCWYIRDTLEDVYHRDKTLPNDVANVCYTLNELSEKNEQLKQALEKDIMRRCEIKEAFNERYGDVE